MNLLKKFGRDWHPFSWDKIHNDGILAEEEWKRMLKATPDAKMKNLKSRIAKYAANVLKGRQVCLPRIGKYILKARADPLHIKNNVCCNIFIRLWVLVYGGTTIHSSVDYDDLLLDEPDHVLV